MGNLFFCDATNFPTLSFPSLASFADLGGIHAQFTLSTTCNPTLRVHTLGRVHAHFTLGTGAGVNFLHPALHSTL